MSHAAKTRALEAYAAELLSPRAVLRLERHLGTCAPCNATLHRVRAYAQLREDADASALPTLAWERLEAALDAPEQPASREQGAQPGHAAQPAGRATPKPRRAPSARGKWVALAWPLLAVAATLAVVWLGVHGSPEPEQARAPAEPARVAEVAPSSPGRVTLIAGEVWLEQAGARTPLALTSEVPQGGRLITSAAAVVHVVLSDGTGFALAPESSVRLTELQKDGVQLDLERGSLTNQVHKLLAHQHYVVTLGTLSARVRGTRFVVEARAAGSTPSERVFVHEGKVEVSRQGQLLALLGAGEAFETPTPGAPVAAAPERSVHASEAKAAQLTDEWGSLSLPALAELHAWIIDGERIAPAGGLQMRLPLGSTQLAFEDARGQLRSITLDLRERETRLEAGALAKLVAPRELRVGSLEPEQITQVIRAGIEPLRRCYERGLRVMPTLAGKLVLSVRVGADGRVQRAEPQSDALPAEIARCISQEATRLVFPRPAGGGAVSFDVPLNLKSH